jgi:Dullard-like phosphatase family protein
MANSLKNLNNFNSILNSSYEIGKIENCRNNNYLNGLNKQLSNNSLLLSKMTEKANSVSNLTNILNPNERYSLNNYYEGEKPNNNAALNNFQHNLFHHNNTYELGLNGQMKNLNNRTQLINLIGNNFLGPNIVQNNPSHYINNSRGNINNFNLKNIFPNNDTVNNNFEQNTNSFSINFEDLIILQEYLREIIILINKNKVIENECFEFWNYYYNSSLCCQLEKLFTNPLDSNAVRISINYTLMSIMICYDYSFELDLLNKIYTTLSDILKLNYKNLILICEHILSRITKESLSNIWVLKLSTIVNASNYNDYNQFLMNGYNMTIVERISYNTNIIVQNLRFLLKNFQSTKNNILTSMFKKIREKTYEEINTFFREKILRITNINGSILGSVFLLQNNNFRTLPSPYVRTKNNKEFSLVLDLYETLINFKPRNNGEEGGILRIRPGINEFLDEVGKYYELIIFTTATQDYADALIDEVEDNKIYFDHRLYREHAVIIDNDFVKDLTRIGRPLDKIIIVDNMPQNFRLQKENGIIIKAFWGEDDHDTALLDLYPILVNIAKEGGDVRKSLVKYKDEIVKNVTSCISKSDNI